MPKKVKYRKHHRKGQRGITYRGADIEFGKYALQATEGGWITAKQIEAVRLAIVRRLKERGKLWIRIFPDRSITKKPQETRMGGGKGDVIGWCCGVKAGRILFEIGGVDQKIALKCLKDASHKLPIKTKIISTDEQIIIK